MDTEIKIRPLKPEDREQWARLWGDYLAFYGTSRPSEIFDTTFARLIDPRAGEFSCLVGEVDGNMAGLTHFLFHRHCWSIEDVCYLQDLFVDPAARGAGLGRALIEGVYGASDAAGCPSVYWITKADNAPARTLYDQISHETGFVRYARET